MLKCDFINHATLCALVEPFSRHLVQPIHELAADIGKSKFLKDGVAYTLYLTPTQVRLVFDETPMPPGTSSLVIWVVNRDFQFGDVSLDESIVDFRIDIPTVMLTRQLDKFHIYRIRLHVPEYEAACNEDGVPNNPLYRGYIGITKRHFYRRFKEHRAAADVGGSSTLYSTWNYLKRNKILHYPALQFTGSAANLDDAYAAEEWHVERKTLNPLGLNTIPGGKAGIKMLHELRLLSGKSTPTIEERDKALVRAETSLERGPPCAHFRAGHMRRLQTGRLTYVKACFVNPQREIVA